MQFSHSVYLTRRKKKTETAERKSIFSPARLCVFSLSFYDSPFGRSYYLLLLYIRLSYIACIHSVPLNVSIRLQASKAKTSYVLCCFTRTIVLFVDFLSLNSLSRMIFLLSSYIQNLVGETSTMSHTIQFLLSCS